MTVVSSLFVSLKRSMAGTRKDHVAIIKALGLRRRERVAQRPNTVVVRGALAKIRHLVSVETDIAREARLVGEAAAKAPREPLRVQHTLVE